VWYIERVTDTLTHADLEAALIAAAANLPITTSYCVVGQYYNSLSDQGKAAFDTITGLGLSLSKRFSHLEGAVSFGRTTYFKHVQRECGCPKTQG
jgi:hypothetical protein